ncbi:MAG: hypothetical protein WCF20_05145 [Methylovirgula sp.]
MRRFTISMMMAIAVAGLVAAGQAQAQNPVDEALGFAFGGHRYCWYPDGWHSAGWYWCGYAHRHGVGWGGGEGFHGWHHDGGHGKPAPRGDHHDDHH